MTQTETRDVDAYRSTNPVRMRDLPTDAPPPQFLVVFELAITGGFDIHCYRRRRFAVENATALRNALKIAALGTANEPRLWKIPKAERMRTALSISSTELLYVAFLIKSRVTGKSYLRFSTNEPAFMACDEVAADRLFAPRNVRIRDNGDIDLRDVNDAAADSEGSRLAFFISDMTNMGTDPGKVSFNINLEVVGKMPDDQGGAAYITPIIIDPDFPHPPENGGIPTFP